MLARYRVDKILRLFHKMLVLGKCFSVKCVKNDLTTYNWCEPVAELNEVTIHQVDVPRRLVLPMVVQNYQKVKKIPRK